jgi:hypothetical protein
MWLPSGQGVWPAFWAIEEERLSLTRDHVFEVDVMEQHGSALDDRYASILNNWKQGLSRIADDYEVLAGNHVLGSWLVFRDGREACS